MVTTCISIAASGRDGCSCSTSGEARSHSALCDPQCEHPPLCGVLHRGVEAEGEWDNLLVNHCLDGGPIRLVVLQDHEELVILFLWGGCPI